MSIGDHTAQGGRPTCAWVTLMFSFSASFLAVINFFVCRCFVTAGPRDLMKGSHNNKRPHDANTQTTSTTMSSSAHDATHTPTTTPPPKPDTGDAFPGLPNHLVVAHILRSECFDDPAILARLREVSRAMCGAVAASGLRVEELDEKRAADLGYFSALQRLQRGGRLSRIEIFCEAAARLGNLEHLKQFRENGAPWDARTCWATAEGGHLEVLQWLRANSCPWDEEMYTMAAGYGQLEVLQWLRANDCKWDVNTCAGAAASGHLEVLRWARANDCPWDEETRSKAATLGYVEDD